MQYTWKNLLELENGAHTRHDQFVRENFNIPAKMALVGQPYRISAGTLEETIVTIIEFRAELRVSGALVEEVLLENAKGLRGWRKFSPAQVVNGVCAECGDIAENHDEFCSYCNQKAAR